MRTEERRMSGSAVVTFNNSANASTAVRANFPRVPRSVSIMLLIGGGSPALFSAGYYNLTERGFDVNLTANSTIASLAQSFVWTAFW